MERQGGDTKHAKVLDAGDAILYDRQIRLWGAASQQKLSESAVLIVGMNGCGVYTRKEKRESVCVGFFFSLLCV